MTAAPRLTVSIAALAVLAGASAAWAHFGSTIYFDMLAASFAGCLF